ncbi:hypothetical protein Tco_1062620 [Tanacetum coccineum]
MATPIDFSKFAMHGLKIDKLTRSHLVGLVYKLLKGTCVSSVELKYTMEECFKALRDKLTWNNPEGDRYPFNMTKPLPLKGRPDLEKRVEDVQLGVESYQKKLNLTRPQKTYLVIKAKELYTPSVPPGVIYEDQDMQKRIMQADELYKFSDGTVTNFITGRSGLIVELIDKQRHGREIIRNFERLVGAKKLEMDYRLMTRTE